VTDSDDAVPPLVRRFRALAVDATRWLPGAPRDTPRTVLGDVLAELDQLDDPDEWDRYGDRGPVAVVETKVAELLGKPAAVFFPSGTMAQQSMLRVWCDRAGSRRVAIPELSHLLKHELDGPRLLHEFAFERLSDGATLPTVENLAEIPGRLGAALLELPLRDAGYLLPTWEELEAFSQACRDRSVPLHIDGARLWESTPGLGRSLAECAALEGDLAAALRMTEDVIETANRIGHATALGDLHCLRGSLLLEQEQYPDAEQEFQLGLDSPDAGEGGCVRALNLLGRSLSRAGDGRPDEENLHAALAALRELGVEVVPHRLGHWLA